MGTQNKKSAATVVAAPRRARSEKGERSRQVILEAALICVARMGLAGVTHRAIAAQAGVPLSLTTYFFSSLRDLVEQAFELMLERTNDQNRMILEAVGRHLATLEPGARFDPAARQRLLDQLTEMLTTFVLTESSVHSVGLAVELNVLYAYRGGGRLRELGEAHRARLVGEIAQVVLQLAPERVAEAETDASLILALLHKLEIDCMNAPEAPPTAQVRREIGRMLQLMFALSERDLAVTTAPDA